MHRVSAPVAPPSRTYYLQIVRLRVLLQSGSTMAFKCISKLARSSARMCVSKPARSTPSISASTVHLQTPSIMASKSPSTLARSRPPSASPNSLDCGLEVHLQTRSIRASNCSSNLARRQPAGALPISLDHSLGVYPCVHSIVILGCTSRLGKLECVLCIMRCLSTPGSPKYILPVAESLPIIPVSPNVNILTGLDNQWQIMR